MTRDDIILSIRTLSRIHNNKPITDDAIKIIIERAIDDFSNKCPFCIAIDRGNSAKGQQEYLTCKDYLEIIEVHYMDSPGVLLNASISDTDMLLTTAAPIDDFPNSGQLNIAGEIMNYSSKDDITRTFTISARGVSNTPAMPHSAGCGIIQANQKFARLEPTSNRRLGDEDGAYISAQPGTPTRYYFFPGIIGFDVPISKTGYHNILIRSFVRPPALVSDASVITGMITTYNSAVVNYGVAKVLQMLSQDDATASMGRSYWADYISNVNEFKKTKHLYVRGDNPQVIPYTGRL